MDCGSKSTLRDNKFKVFMHELAHHLPYATLSVACALMLLSLMDVFFFSDIVKSTMSSHAHTGCCHGDHFHGSPMDLLFHAFHYTHILFAVSGVMLTFYRYSKRVIPGIIIGVISAATFCTFSDVLLPYVGGLFLGFNMNLHICFTSELSNILPFVVIGVLNGLVMFYIKELKTELNSLKLHFLHTFISAMASTFYAIGNGFSDFHTEFGMFFLMILVAVVIPCTLSDVIVPIVCAHFIGEK